EQAVNQDSLNSRLLPRLFVVRAHSAFLGATRVALSGQVPETFCLLRLAIELAWYALHIADDASSRRAKIWLARGDNDAATHACRTNFTVKNVHATHQRLAPARAVSARRLYDLLIDLGAHPN